MPTRRTRSFRKSRPNRRRTRWYALVPHAMLHLADNSWDSQLMEIQDSRGTVVDWRSLTGASILRTIVSYTMHPTYPDTLVAPADWWSTVHLGFFLDKASAVQADRWDPNEPHGEFMWRGTWNERVSVRPAGGGDIVWAVSDGATVNVDTIQRRRLREDDRLWTTSAFFSAVDSTPMAIGYNGRVLVALP